MRDKHPLPVAVLFSGRGSNLAYLLNCVRQQRLRLRICTAITDRANAAGLNFLLQHSTAGHIFAGHVIAGHSIASHIIASHIIDYAQAAGQQHFEQLLTRAIAGSGAELIVLAGFMRILSAEFTNQHAGRIINLHPSLLPAYPGLHTHQRVLSAGDKMHGASIHFVNASLDGGPVLAQYRMPVTASATAASLAAELQPHEHRLLAACLALFCDHKVTCRNDSIMIDNRPLCSPLLLDKDLTWQ